LGWNIGIVTVVPLLNDDVLGIAGIGTSIINLLALEFYILILAHPVCKM
jgi:hypothetical protein